MLLRILADCWLAAISMVIKHALLERFLFLKPLDSFELYDSSNTKIPINEQNIAWKADMEHKYKRAPDSEKIQWIDPTNGKWLFYLKDFI